MQIYKFIAKAFVVLGCSLLSLYSNKLVIQVLSKIKSHTLNQAYFQSLFMFYFFSNSNWKKKTIFFQFLTSSIRKLNAQKIYRLYPDSMTLENLKDTDLYTLFIKEMILSGWLDLHNTKVIWKKLHDQNSQFLSQTSLVVAQEYSTKLKVLYLTDPKINAEESFFAFPSNVFQFQDPQVYGENVSKELRQVQIEEQRVFRYSKVTIGQGFQIHKDDSLILYDKSADPRIGIVAGLWKSYTSIGNELENICLYRHTYKAETHYQAGILLSGRATGNYYHWLIEYLPRILNLEKSNIPLSTPLIVKENLPQQFYAALNMINPGYPILRVSLEDHLISVEDLYVPSMHSFLPDDFTSPFWTGGGMSSGHLQYARAKVLEHVNLTPKFPKKIYLKRSGTRSLENTEEIEKELARKGFTFFRTESLTFEEQVNLFYNAEIIIGAGGAAFANVLFVNPKCQIICMVSEHNKEFCIFSNLAKIQGASYMNLVGKNKYPKSHFANIDEFAHSSFSINPKDLKFI